MPCILTPQGGTTLTRGSNGLCNCVPQPEPQHTQPLSANDVFALLIEFHIGSLKSELILMSFGSLSTSRSKSESGQVQLKRAGNS